MESNFGDYCLERELQKLKIETNKRKRSQTNHELNKDVFNRILNRQPNKILSVRQQKNHYDGFQNANLGKNKRRLDVAVDQAVHHNLAMASAS